MDDIVIRLREYAEHYKRLTSPLEQFGYDFLGDEAADTIDSLRASNAKLRDALTEVLHYRRGEGKYNFASLPDDERACASFDAWQEVEATISAVLATAPAVPPNQPDRVLRAGEESTL